MTIDRLVARNRRLGLAQLRARSKKSWKPCTSAAATRSNRRGRRAASPIFGGARILRRCVMTLGLMARQGPCGLVVSTTADCRRCLRRIHQGPALAAARRGGDVLVAYELNALVQCYRRASGRIRPLPSGLDPRARFRHRISRPGSIGCLGLGESTVGGWAWNDGPTVALAVSFDAGVHWTRPASSPPPVAAGRASPRHGCPRRLAAMRSPPVRGRPTDASSPLLASATPSIASPSRSYEIGPSLPATYRLDEASPVAQLYRGGWRQPGKDAHLPTCVTGHKVHGASRLPTAGPTLARPSSMNFSLAAATLPNGRTGRRRRSWSWALDFLLKTQANVLILL